jgi:hypothetical protein
MKPELKTGVTSTAHRQRVRSIETVAPPLQQGEEATSQGEAKVTAKLGKIVLKVAWLAILLGFIIEVILITVAISLSQVQGLKPFIADLAQKISWSTIVCVGIALGTATSKLRVQMMGLAGMLAAPLAFNIARTLQKTVAETLALATTAATGPSPFLMGLVKGVEYACLGAALGWVGKKPWGKAPAYIATGLITGALFGGSVLAVTLFTAKEPVAPAELLSKAINELLFPVGCSLVLFASNGLEKVMKH